MKINTLTVKFDDGMPIYKQLFDFIKSCIMGGRFSPGDILPPTRSLASDMGISRTSILNAYNALVAEGYINSIRGSGYIVNALPSVYDKQSQKKKINKNHSIRYMPFNPEPIDTTFFPSHKWAKTISKIGREKSLSLLYTSQYDKFGYWELREMICNYVHEKKGILCRPEQVIITSGSMESLEVCVNILTRPGQTLSIEDPNFPPMHSYLLNHNRKLNYMQVDSEGAICEDIANESKVVIITSGSQFPLGIPMGHDRKNEFINWAHNSDGWIIEDDYDSDFNADPKSSVAIFHMDKNGRTFYLSSFSRLITSELKLGFIVLPEHSIQLFKDNDYSFKTSYLPQLILAEFIKTGDFYKNLVKAKKIYADKRKFFTDLLNEQLSAFGHPFKEGGGSFVAFILDPRLSDLDVAEYSKGRNLDLMPLSPMCQEVIRNGFLMGFIHFNREALKKSVILLKNTIILYCYQNNINML